MNEIIRRFRNGFAVKTSAYLYIRLIVSVLKFYDSFSPLFLLSSDIFYKGLQV